ncbi:hemopexin fold protein [Tanacetum coccineum]
MWNKIRRPLALFPQRENRKVATSIADIIEYDIEEVTKSYLDSAFRSTRTNEAYLFFQNEYVVLNYYAPRTTDDWVVNGPLYIQNGLHSLVGTFFAAYGIDVAFGCHGGDDESFIFGRNLCAKINKILEGPKTIRQMFPFFKGTEFEGGVDAAFES